MSAPSAGHGDRRTYQAGCRCRLCRSANAAYTAVRRAAKRAGTVGAAPDRVSAAPARDHLVRLRELGVGYRQAARLAGLREADVRAIRAGRVERIRCDTALRILGVKPVLRHGQLVPAWRTWRLIDSLRREGFTQAEIARRLGLRTPQLRIRRRRIRVKTALKVRQLWHRIMDDDPERDGDEQLPQAPPPRPPARCDVGPDIPGGGAA